MDKLLISDAVKNLLQYSKVQTDHGVFRMHYKITATLLLACSALVTATQFFGDPIRCVTYDVIKAETMNSYCWVEGTITLPRSLNGTLGADVAAPGVDQRRINKDDKVLEHSYYQWVALFLFFQAGAFYLPRWLWRIWEHGRMKALVNELSKPALTKKKQEENLEVIAKYFIEHRFENQKYAYRFFLCELLTLANVLLQIYLVDRFLGYQFWTYGIESISYLAQDPGVRVDPMSKVFPKMSKCRFRRFGTSGEVQIHDAICLLSLNIINEKIFVFLWFWFNILAVATLSSIVYRTFVIRTNKYRYQILGTVSTMVVKTDLKRVAEEGKYGDWFLLSLLKDNIKPHHFREVVTNLSMHLNNGDGNPELGYRPLCCEKKTEKKETEEDDESGKSTKSSDDDNTGLV